MYRASGPREMRPVGETEFVAGIGAMSDSGGYGKTRVAAGIVGYADLTKGDWVEPVLEAHIRAGGGRFRGVRHSGGWDADPIIGNSAAGYGARALRARRTSAPGWRDCRRWGCRWMPGYSIRSTATWWRWRGRFRARTSSWDIAEGRSATGLMPGRRDEVFAAWKASVTELATCPNVTMKLGGMMMRLAAIDYMAQPRPPSSEELAALWRPYIETCIELFGPRRCMFESNFPVEKMGIGWAALWNAFKLLARSASTDEKRALFSGTAQRVYRLAL